MGIAPTNISGGSEFNSCHLLSPTTIVANSFSGAPKHWPQCDLSLHFPYEPSQVPSPLRNEAQVLTSFGIDLQTRKLLRPLVHLTSFCTFETLIRRNEGLYQRLIGISGPLIDHGVALARKTAPAARPLRGYLPQASSVIDGARASLEKRVRPKWDWMLLMNQSTASGLPWLSHCVSSQEAT